jgi:hypothetical protein
MEAATYEYSSSLRGYWSPLWRPRAKWKVSLEGMQLSGSIQLLDIESFITWPLSTTTMAILVASGIKSTTDAVKYRICFSTLNGDFYLWNSGFYLFICFICMSSPRFFHISPQDRSCQISASEKLLSCHISARICIRNHNYCKTV